jgi:hypothetical protein
MRWVSTDEVYLIMPLYVSKTKNDNILTPTTKGKMYTKVSEYFGGILKLNRSKYANNKAETTIAVSIKKIIQRGVFCFTNFIKTPLGTGQN